MALTLKEALLKLKQKPDAKLHFFYCAKNRDGKPEVIADKKKFDPDENEDVKALMARAQGSATGRGSMWMQGTNLILSPKKGGVVGERLVIGFTVAAKQQNVLNLIEEIQTVDELEAPAEPAEAPVAAAPPQDRPSTGADPYLAAWNDDAYGGDAYGSESGTASPAAAPPPLPPALPPMLTPERLKQLQGKQVTRHDDPLFKAHPALGKMREMRIQAAARLQTALNRQPPDPKAVNEAEQELDKIDDAIVEAQRKLNAKGVSPKALGEEYRGEEHMAGWRAPKPGRGNLSEEDYQEQLRRWERARQSPSRVTEYFDSQERDLHELHADPEGRLHTDMGLPASGSQDYVLGADEKTLHTFRPQSSTRQQAGPADTTFEQTVYTHHSSILAGAPVTGAGGLTFSNGKITSISNSSGHYKPHTSHLLQTVEQLLQQGLLLDKTYVMVDPATGKGVPLTGKAKDLYDKTLQAQQRIEMGKAVLRRQEREVDTQVRRIELLVDEQGSCRSGAEPEFQSGLEELVRLLKEAHATDEALKRDIDLVGKARDLLRRLGATEANRIDDSVQVMNLDVSDTMRGHQVKKASSSAKQVSLKEFVTSGGGQKGEAHLKKTMQQELLAKQAEVRKKLDEAAPEADPAWRPEERPVPDSELDDALEKLTRLAPEPPTPPRPQPIDDDDDEVTY